MKQHRILVLFLAVIFAVSLLTGCGGKETVEVADQDVKTAATPDAFVALLQKNGFEVVDYSNQFGEGYTVYGAIDPSMQYQIQFFELPDEESTRYSFENKQAELAANKDATSAEVAITGGNYEAYSITTDADYLLISRIANTFLYADVPSGFEKDVQDIASKLGY